LRLLPAKRRYDTGVEASKLMSVAAALTDAAAAKAAGAMRSAWVRHGARPRTTISTPSAPWSGVKSLGLESLRHAGHAERSGRRGGSKDAGLDYYNHNLDTRRVLCEIITTRTYQIASTPRPCARRRHNVCCGAIVGMGEGREDRVGMIATLASRRPIPKRAHQHAGAVAGTPLATGGKSSIRSSSCAHRVRVFHMAAAMVRLSPAPRDERRDAGAVLPRRPEIDLLRAPSC